MIRRYSKSTSTCQPRRQIFFACPGYHPRGLVEVEVRASRYIALWNGDSKALRASLERIAKTARGIIDDVEASAGRKAVA